MKEAVLVFLGGGAGSALRYLVGKSMIIRLGDSFPWHTLTINVIGSLLLGFVITALECSKEETQLQMRLLIAVGFCGGFTTFSSFAYENLRLLQTQPVFALLYTAASLMLGLVAVFGGLLVGRWALL